MCLNYIEIRLRVAGLALLHFQFACGFVARGDWSTSIGFVPVRWSARGRAALAALVLGQGWPRHLWRGAGGAGGAATSGPCPLLPREVLPSLPLALCSNPIVPVLEPAGSSLAACLWVLKSPIPVVEKLTLCLKSSLTAKLSVWSFVSDQVSFISSSFRCSPYFPLQFFHFLQHSPVVNFIFHPSKP